MLLRNLGKIRQWVAIPITSKVIPHTPDWRTFLQASLDLVPSRVNCDPLVRHAPQPITCGCERALACVALQDSFVDTFTHRSHDETSLSLECSLISVSSDSCKRTGGWGRHKKASFNSGGDWTQCATNQGITGHTQAGRGELWVLLEGCDPDVTPRVVILKC